MEIAYNNEDLDLYLRTSANTSPEHPTLVDKFMEDYVEVDVDAVSDGEEVYIGGIMAHGEEADRKSTRLNSSHAQISYSVFCLKKKKTDCLSLFLLAYEHTHLFLHPAT